jgi:hypothetical protein
MLSGSLLGTTPPIICVQYLIFKVAYYNALICQIAQYAVNIMVITLSQDLVKDICYYIKNLVITSIRTEDKIAKQVTKKRK